jgi:transcriptional regulator with XRE-family HTH domain
MSAHMHPLAPPRSATDVLGATVRTRRSERRLSQAALGRLVLASADLIRKIERGQRFPHEDLIRALDAILGGVGELTAMWNTARIERAAHPRPRPCRRSRLADAVRHERVARLLRRAPAATAIPAPR